jgi:hypothetical protein
MSCFLAWDGVVAQSICDPRLTLLSAPAFGVTLEEGKDKSAPD